MARTLLRILLVIGAVSGVAHAEDRYIDDSLTVPLHDDSSNSSGVVHAGLPRGTAVTLVREETGTGWSRVRTREGVEGWIPSRYLKREPGARYQVMNSLRMLGQPDDGSVRLDDAIAKLQADMGTARSERDALQAQLAELRKVSENATELDRNNRQLGEELQMLKNEVGVLKAENERLQDSEWQKWFIAGCWATGVGGVMTVLVWRIAAGRRRRSEWF